MKAEKKGFIYKVNNPYEWWHAALQAPAPIIYDENTIRIYVGAWDSEIISRLAYIDVDINNPTRVKKLSSTPILDIGRDGCFDDNGVFPAHVYNFGNGTVYLYYTGFQKLDKIAFSNFSGLAVSYDGGDTFKRISEAPVMDRADEGLYTRAGISIYPCDDSEEGFHCVYSAGNSWFYLNGKKRPVYEVFYQKTTDGIHFSTVGKKVVACNLEVEHGLGRPQIIKLGDKFFVFYTRRIIKDMKYFLGCSYTTDFKTWTRYDEIFDNVYHGGEGEFDYKMIYFPAVVKVNDHKAYCFYTGNHYGEDGIGYIKLTF